MMLEMCSAVQSASRRSVGPAAKAILVSAWRIGWWDHRWRLDSFFRLVARVSMTLPQTGPKTRGLFEVLCDCDKNIQQYGRSPAGILDCFCGVVALLLTGLQWAITTAISRATMLCVLLCFLLGADATAFLLLDFLLYWRPGVYIVRSGGDL